MNNFESLCVDIIKEIIHRMDEETKWLFSSINNYFRKFIPTEYTNSPISCKIQNPQLICYSKMYTCKFYRLNYIIPKILIYALNSLRFSLFRLLLMSILIY